MLVQASPEAVKLVNMLLQWNPARRPTAQQALKYCGFSFIKEIVFILKKNICLCYISHSFFSRNHNPSAMMQQQSSNNKSWANGNGQRLSVGVSRDTAASSMSLNNKYPQAVGRISNQLRYHMASETSLSDRQVVQSEPTRPKPDWPGPESKKKDSDEVDEFDEIIQ